MIRKKPFSGYLLPFAARKKQVIEFLEIADQSLQVEVHVLNDSYGPSLQDGIDSIVVSSETASGADDVNARRKELGQHERAETRVSLMFCCRSQPITGY
jgi:phosphopantetheine adenylyltransferase